VPDEQQEDRRRKLRSRKHKSRSTKRDLQLRTTFRLTSCPVCQAVLDAVSGEFVGVSRGQDVVALDLGVDNLDDDVLVGESHDEAVLGGVVLVLGLGYEALACVVVGLALCSRKHTQDQLPVSRDTRHGASRMVADQIGAKDYKIVVSTAPKLGVNYAKVNLIPWRGRKHKNQGHVHKQLTSATAVLDLVPREVGVVLSSDVGQGDLKFWTRRLSRYLDELGEVGRQNHTNSRAGSQYSLSGKA
jgi:hypothetical protein